MTRCLSKLFEVRHILCHEAPRKSVYEKGEVDEFLAAAVGFATAIGEVLRFEKFGLVPLTQLDMNISAGKDLEEAEGNLMQILVEIENRIRAVDSENPSSDGLLAESNWLQISKKPRKAGCLIEMLIVNLQHI